MKDAVTVNNVETLFSDMVNKTVTLTYAQIEAAHAEMVKQKAENEIKLGDIVKVWASLRLVTKVQGNRIYFGESYTEDGNAGKVTGTPEFMAELRAKLEGK